MKFHIHIATLAAVVLAGCQSVDGPPERSPDIRGQITMHDADGRIRVEEDPSQSSGSQKAVVRITESTSIFQQQGDHLTAADTTVLSIGRTVRIWFDGPVMESYPVQATAGAIVAE